MRTASRCSSAALLLSCAAAAAVPDPGVVSPAGKRLAEFLDGTGVEHLWQADHYVDWKTGEPTTRPLRGGVRSSHCSAYAAAVADRLGVYLLRPPRHGLALLANAQYAWLLSADGPDHGWTPADTAEQAQGLANAGQLVVAVYRAPDPSKPGHIAVVRPAVRTAADLADTGPEIIQAGASNYTDTTVSVGFHHHRGAWDAGGKAVKFFAHPIGDADPPR